jgi:Lon-like protease
MTASRGRVWATVAMALIALVVIASAVVPIPYLARSPGPIFDILGESDGKPVLEIKDTKSYPTTGSLDMTTVAESGGDAGVLTIGAAVAGLFSSETSVVPDEDYLNGVSKDDERQLQEQVFDASQSNALGAAATYLKRPVHAKPVIMDVVPGSPSDGKLSAGDIVVSVNGKSVTDAAGVGDIVSKQPAGTTFSFVVGGSGGKAARTMKVTSAPSPEDPERAVVGILVNNHYSSDFRAVVNLSDIGGPSAGLMLALGMVDRLTPDDLVANRRVAGTGTIDGDGAVGAIGGVDKKMLAAQSAGAELFIAPADNCDEVVSATPEGLQVVPVRTLADAVTALHTWRGGGRLASCPSSPAPDGNG